MSTADRKVTVLAAIARLIKKAAELQRQKDAFRAEAGALEAKRNSARSSA